MSREQNYLGIILKKQQLSEADELVTFYTQEAGKVRAVAKSSKLPKSKLQSQLQPMFLCRLAVVGSGSLPTIIRVQAEQSFARIQNDPDRVRFWFVAAELVLKATADEEKNDLLFVAIEQFLHFLDSDVLTQDAAPRGLVKFKLAFTDALGVTVLAPEYDSSQPMFFSASRGGFVQDEKPADALPVHPNTVRTLDALRRGTYSDMLTSDSNVDELNDLLTQFITYQLEREIKSEKFV